MSSSPSPPVVLFAVTHRRPDLHHHLEKRVSLTLTSNCLKLSDSNSGKMLVYQDLLKGCFGGKRKFKF
ncbi:hypothetical protein K1719_040432 [Acacia pycnantha]|nr:hypothetical protein K1719_040432 [Acacia pycnantha]